LFTRGSGLVNSGRDNDPRVSETEIEQMTSAAAVIRACRRALAARNIGLLDEIGAGCGALSDWRHYPDGEVYDPRSHAQYFFHAHPGRGRRATEHGHFHTFLCAEGMPIGMMPLVLPELAVADVAPAPPQAAPRKRCVRDEVSHLVAIATDARGEPIQLFTTNRWVTGETWYRSQDVIQMLDRFVIAEAEPSQLLNRWIGAIVRLFRPQITALLVARDEKVMAWRRRRRTHVFEDPRLEVTSSLDISLDAQLAFVDDMRAGDIRTGSRALSRLPPMAEGWE